MSIMGRVLVSVMAGVSLSERQSEGKTVPLSMLTTAS